MTLPYVLMLFFAYSFLGWCTEVVYAAANTGRFVNRGFLNGPVCPIYGYGLLLVVACLEPIRGNLFALICGAALLTSGLELLTGFLTDRLLHLRLWDYSKVPFNLHGYICLKFSLLWGLACAFIVRVVHPMVRALVLRLPGTLTLVLDCVFGAAFCADLIVTLIAARRLPQRLAAIGELERALDGVSAHIGGGLTEGVQSVRERSERLRGLLRERGDELRDAVRERAPELEPRFEQLRAQLSRRSRIHERLMKAFPELKEAQRRRRAPREDAAKKN